MTAGGNLICTKCGFSNAPGDQFCGSCGAFLEWEGVPAEPVVPATGTGDIPIVPPRQGTGDAGSYPGPGSHLADVPVIPPVVTTPVVAATPPDTGLVRCPACGIANQAGRTFCQSCGTKLPEAARVTGATPEQIAAAVNAPNRPPDIHTRASEGSHDDDGSSGGIVKWLVALALLGVLLGIGFVAVTSLLRGPGTAGPSAEPTSAVVPSAGSSGTPSGAPSEDPSNDPGESATPSPAESVRLALTDASASSTVGPDLPAFLPTKAIDGDPATSWQEGARNEKGQWVEVTFEPATVTSVLLSNGYNKSRPLYRGNHRLKAIKVYVGDAEPISFTLKDTGQPQRIPMEPVEGATRVRVEIVSVYPAVKTRVANTPFDDAALDEIVVMGITTP